MGSKSLQEGSFDAIIQAVEAHLRESLAQNSGSLYVKSRDVAEDLDLSSKQVGAVMGTLRESDTEVTVERWAYSGGTTWRVSDGC